MLTIQPTPRKVGIKISGDYLDLQSLIDALEWQYQKEKNKSNHDPEYALELLSDLLFITRSAIRGVQDVESVENGAKNTGQLFLDLSSERTKYILELRRTYERGNLYYTFVITSIEAFAYLRHLHRACCVNDDINVMNYNNDPFFLQNRMKSTLYLFYSLLLNAVCVLLGQERTLEVLLSQNDGMANDGTSAYQYEYLTYLKNSFLSECVQWETPQIEDAVYGLSLLLCRTPKSDAVKQMQSSSAPCSLLERLPDSAGFPKVYDELAAQSEDGQVYMDIVFPRAKSNFLEW